MIWEGEPWESPWVNELFRLKFWKPNNMEGLLWSWNIIFPVTSAGIADSPKRLVSFQSESKWTIDIYIYIHISYIYIFRHHIYIYTHLHIYIYLIYIYILYHVYMYIVLYHIYISYIYDIYIYIIYIYDIYHIYMIYIYIYVYVATGAERNLCGPHGPHIVCPSLCQGGESTAGGESTCQTSSATWLQGEVLSSWC